MKIYLAPLQGYTEFAYRKAYTHFFSGIDNFILPYVSLEKNGEVRKKYIRETSPENNIIEKSTPQVLCKTAEELLFWKDFFKSRSYSEINLNLGCPFPMVTKKGKGAKLLETPEVIEQLLDEYYQKTDFPLSIKMRLGMTKNDDYEKVSEVINRFPITKVFLHARTANQMYKGKVDIDGFKKCSDLLNIETIYNGDVNSIETLDFLSKNSVVTDSVMLGRGVLKNPFLPMIIKGEELPSYENQKSKIFEFHDMFLEILLTYLNDDHQVLTHIKPFWDYLSEFFPAEYKIKKMVKKAGNLRKYKEFIASVRNF